MSHANYIMIDWNKDRVLQLINCWKRYECLYNPGHDMYSNKTVRHEALEKITRQLQVTAPVITLNAVKTKMNYLRSQYCREMHKYNMSKKHGNEGNEYHKNTPYWFDNMSFVRRYVKVRTGESKRGSIELNLSDHHNTSNEEIELPKPIKLRKSSENSINENSPSSTEQTDEPAVYLYKPDPDILELFQKQLSKVTSSQQNTSLNSSITSTQPGNTSSSEQNKSSNITLNSEYDQTFLNFIKINMSFVTDAALKDELMDKITMLLLEYKGKQRKLDA